MSQESSNTPPFSRSASDASFSATKDEDSTAVSSSSTQKQRPTFDASSTLATIKNQDSSSTTTTTTQRPTNKMQKNLRRALTGDENKRVRDHAKLNLQKTSQQVKKRVRKVVTGSPNTRVRDWAKAAKVVKTVDKFSFVLGVTVLCTTEFMWLQYPQHFDMYYVSLISIMMALRLYMYAKNKWLYFLIDFCYMCNASCFVSVLYAPDNAALWRLNFSVTNGTLLGAILAWRNSLVFHSLDKVTSIAIHLLPAILTYLERWNYNGKMCLSENCSIGIQGALLEPLLFYTFWQGLYILKTEVMDRQIMLANPHIQTSLRWLTRDAKNPMHIIAKRVCRTIGVLSPTEEFDPESLKTKCVFWIGNLLFVVMTLLPIPILFSHVRVHTFYILFVLSTAVYNGSNYYFEVFASRYIQKLEEQERQAIQRQEEQQLAGEGETVIVEVEQAEQDESNGDDSEGNGEDTIVFIEHAKQE